MAETGMEGIPVTDYFTRVVAPVIEPSGMAWILFWRNAWEPDKPGHFYLPYKGHAAEGDFKAFIADDRILMNKTYDDETNSHHSRSAASGRRGLRTENHKREIARRADSHDGPRGPEIAA